MSLIDSALGGLVLFLILVAVMAAFEIIDGGIRNGWDV